MKGLYAYKSGRLEGRVVDSGVSSGWKWVTVLGKAGKPVTGDEEDWSFVRPEEMVVVCPQAVETARQELKVLANRLHTGHDLSRGEHQRLTAVWEARRDMLRMLGLEGV